MISATTEMRILKKTGMFLSIKDALLVIKRANDKLMCKQIETTNLKLEHELFMCEVEKIKNGELL
jgi:hypothetical protein